MLPIISRAFALLFRNYSGLFSRQAKVFDIPVLLGATGLHPLL